MQGEAPGIMLEGKSPEENKLEGQTPEVMLGGESPEVILGGE